MRARGDDDEEPARGPDSSLPTLLCVCACGIRAQIRNLCKTPAPPPRAHQRGAAPRSARMWKAHMHAPPIFSHTPQGVCMQKPFEKTDFCTTPPNSDHVSVWYTLGITSLRSGATCTFMYHSLRRLGSRIYPMVGDTHSEADST